MAESGVDASVGIFPDAAGIEVLGVQGTQVQVGVHPQGQSAVQYSGTIDPGLRLKFSAVAGADELPMSKIAVLGGAPTASGVLQRTQ